MTTDKRRKRRVAADEAHAWARNLRLRNHHAKNVLRSLTLYVDGDGVCFVGIEQLADDCELSPDTVRRRLVWLEEIGAISRQKQWIDDRGVRNGDGRGRQTSDQIRLLLEADEDRIEAMAAGRVEAEIVANSTPISPSRQQGLNPPAEEVSPAPALRQPSHCGEGLISEPEPESPPKPSSGGPAGDADAGEEGEADEAGELFGHFKTNYPDSARWPWSIVWPVFAAMAPAEQRAAAAASGEYARTIAAIKPRATAVRPDKFLRRRIFDNYPHARLPEKAAATLEPRWICGEELAGFLVACRLADRRPPRLVDDPERGRGFAAAMKRQADLVAMAKFEADDPHAWPVAERGSEQCAAWRARLKLWLGGEVEARKVFLEPYSAAVHGLPHTHPDFRFRKSQTGLPMPAPWPPHRDGTWPDENSNEGNAA